MAGRNSTKVALRLDAAMAGCDHDAACGGSLCKAARRRACWQEAGRLRPLPQDRQTLPGWSVASLAGSGAHCAMSI